MPGPADEAAIPPTPLREMQRDLQVYLLGAESPIEAAIVDAPPLTVPERLGIYHNAYRVRLIDALDRKSVV